MCCSIWALRSLSTYTHTSQTVSGPFPSSHSNHIYSICSCFSSPKVKNLMKSYRRFQMLNTQRQQQQTLNGQRSTFIKCVWNKFKFSFMSDPTPELDVLKPEKNKIGLCWAPSITKIHSISQRCACAASRMNKFILRFRPSFIAEHRLLDMRRCQSN